MRNIAATSLIATTVGIRVHGPISSIYWINVSLILNNYGRKRWAALEQLDDSDNIRCEPGKPANIDFYGRHFVKRKIIKAGVSLGWAVFKPEERSVINDMSPDTPLEANSGPEGFIFLVWEGWIETYMCLGIYNVRYLIVEAFARTEYS